MGKPIEGPVWIGRHTVGIDWVIVGGESGKDFRPMATEWAQSLHDQCAAASVPFFCKQGAGPKSGLQYDLPSELFSVKQFPAKG
jgi:protein gp37